MEAFDVKFTPEGNNQVRYTVVPQQDESFLILVNNAPTCSIRMKDEDSATWEACEGSLSDAEMEFLSEAIESKYM